MHHILFLFYSMLCALSEGQEGVFDAIPLSTPYDDEISPKIYGGEMAKQGEFPYTVSLQRFDDVILGEYRHFCGGIILNKRVILTAAHCMRGTTDVSLLRLVAGTIYAYDSGHGAQFTKINRFFIHPFYDSPSISNDIAIVIIDPPLNYTNHLRPVTLPTKGQEPEGKCIVSGWGNTGLHSLPSDTLQKVELTITERNQCPKSIKAISKVDYLFDFTMICSHEINKGARKGDSGGPMMCKNKRKNYYLAGVVSWGLHLCGNDQCTGSVDLVSVFSHAGYNYCFIRDKLLLYPDDFSSRSIGGNTSASVRAHVKPPTKKICKCKSVNKTSNISETKKRLFCKLNGEKCDRFSECCTRYCRISVGRGKVCTMYGNEDPESNPPHENFSMEKFLFAKFLYFKGWVGAVWWVNDTGVFTTFNDVGKIKKEELPALRDNIFIPDTCCFKDTVYILDSQKQHCLRIDLGIVQLSLIQNWHRISYVFEINKGMVILITEDLHEEQDRLEAWRIADYWRDELIRAGR